MTTPGDDASALELSQMCCTQFAVSRERVLMQPVQVYNSVQSCRLLKKLPQFSSVQGEGVEISGIEM
jgi:hypothetical protein